MARIVESRIEWRYPNEGEAYQIEVAWEMPRPVTEKMVADAKAYFPVAQTDCQNAGRDAIERWLTALGTLCAGKMGVEEAQAKLKAYSSMLEVPASVLTKQTLDEAARKFTWFPAYGEIAEFLDSKAQIKRKIRDRLDRIAKARPEHDREPGFTPWSQRTPEQKKMINDALRRAGIETPIE